MILIIFSEKIVKFNRKTWLAYRVEDYESSTLSVLKRTKIFVSDLQEQYIDFFSSHKILFRNVFVTVFNYNRWTTLLVEKLQAITPFLLKIFYWLPSDNQIVLRCPKIGRMGSITLICPVLFIVVQINAKNIIFQFFLYRIYYTLN